MSPEAVRVALGRVLLWNAVKRHEQVTGAALPLPLLPNRCRQCLDILWMSGIVADEAQLRDQAPCIQLGAYLIEHCGGGRSGILWEQWKNQDLPHPCVTKPGQRFFY